MYLLFQFYLCRICSCSSSDDIAYPTPTTSQPHLSPSTPLQHRKLEQIPPPPVEPGRLSPPSLLNPNFSYNLLTTSSHFKHDKLTGCKPASQISLFTFCHAMRLNTACPSHLNRLVPRTQMGLASYTILLTLVSHILIQLIPPFLILQPNCQPIKHLYSTAVSENLHSMAGR
jgi:hypothetical protein